GRGERGGGPRDGVGGVEALGGEARAFGHRHCRAGWGGAGQAGRDGMLRLGAGPAGSWRGAAGDERDAASGGRPRGRAARSRGPCAGAGIAAAAAASAGLAASGMTAVLPKTKDWLFIQRFRGIIAASLENRQQG